MSDITIKLQGQEFKIKITLGFFKNLGFMREELQSITNNGFCNDRFTQCLKLAVFYGNKNDSGWKSIDDMLDHIDVIEALDEIDSEEGIMEIYNALQDAFILHMPKAEKEEEGTKKK